LLLKDDGRWVDGYEWYHLKHCEVFLMRVNYWKHALTLTNVITMTINIGYNVKSLVTNIGLEQVSYDL